MSERCAFEGNCPMEPDVIELSGACTNSRGERCGPIAAYGMLTGQFEGLEDLDDESPIAGTFTFDTVPVGMPPQEVREGWVGVTVPVRHPERLERGEVELSPADAILSLLSSGKLDATDWFFKSGLALAPFGARWVFQTTEGAFAESEPVDSRDFYGSRLSKEARTVIDEEL